MNTFLHTAYTCLCVSTGDIGGQMGLFIGASILTILELFDYAYEVSLLLKNKWLPLPLTIFVNWLLQVQKADT